MIREILSLKIEMDYDDFDQWTIVVNDEVLYRLDLHSDYEWHLTRKEERLDKSLFLWGLIERTRVSIAWKPVGAPWRGDALGAVHTALVTISSLHDGGGEDEYLKYREENVDYEDYRRLGWRIASKRP